MIAAIYVLFRGRIHYVRTRDSSATQAASLEYMCEMHRSAN